ncbi:MAG TPA: FAD-dependent oxidoreductase [Pseudonocardiaceae bacterium]|jgi:predicted NAD/FAD-binding protein|nr:FAD-dependent oxidoreductase [Pseudonocardiaceae bacterium]
MMTTAVIGSGIAGLTAAYLLERTSEVTLYEADPRLGGHADTRTVVPIGDGAPLALDCAFTVYNEHRYPYLSRLLRELGVATHCTEMSLSIRCEGCGIEYSARSGLRGLPRDLPAACGQVDIDLLSELVEFNRLARSVIADRPRHELTLGKMLADSGVRPYFAQHVVLPLVCIVWSCDPEMASQYPVATLLDCLDTHGMLTASAASRWRTIVGGSTTYVERAAATLTEVLRGTPVRALRRGADGVEVRDAADRVRRFDRAVIATHPDQALQLLADPTQAEAEVLAAIGYSRNHAVLHTDSSILPQQASNRSAWNYRQKSCQPGSSRPALTYYLNRLHGIDSDTDYLLTLGGSEWVDPSQVLARMDYEHPVHTPDSVAARERLPELTSSVVAYAGAYHGVGFHEDGCRAGAAAAEAFGVVW